jgi:protein TonB
MKRSEKNAPGFDEIIFGNRNKEYGAYKLRKQYKSVTSLSIFGGAAFATLLVASLFFSIEKGTASTGPVSVIIELTDPLIPEIVVQPEVKPPAALTQAVRNLQPVVVTDTTATMTYIPTNDELNATVTNRNVNDTVVYNEPVDVIVPVEIKPYILVEEMPEFPGGIPALLKYVGENLIYPVEAQELNMQGKVTLRFVVNRDGSVDRVEVLKGVDPLLDNEAIRVVKTLPKFKPGKQQGVAVPVWFSLPVVFQIKNN